MPIWPSRRTRPSGFDHRELSADLLAHWGLPESLVHAVDRRRDPVPPLEAGEPARPLADTVEAAEWFARLLADGNPEALGGLLSAPVGRQLCRFSRDELVELVEDFEVKVFQLAEILSLKLPEGRDYRDVLAEAHDQLADAAAEAADELIERGRPSRGDDIEPALAGAVESLAAAAAVLSAPRSVARSEPAESPAAQGSVATVARPLTASQPRPSAAAVCDAGLLDRLSVAAAACRQCRRSLSLLLVQFDTSDGQVLAGGVEDPSHRLPEIEAICDGLDYPGAACLPLGQTGFALILPGCDRDEAVRLGHRSINIAAARSPGDGQPSRAIASVGVATVAMPPKNFAHEKLLSSADRCLYAARASGGGVVKSIEIY